MLYDMCIVGAGLSGSTIARLAAEDGKKVLVLEKREHIGGNVYDTLDEITNIRISMYGAHIFHTNDEEVWTFVNRFGLWKRWDHQVLSLVNGTYVPMPITITTVNTLFNLNIQSEDEMKTWLSKERIQCDTPVNSEESALNRVGQRIYDYLFHSYTRKQWDKEPSELEPSVLDRIPLRTNFDTRYFSDKYQGLPVDGYTSLVSNMLNHENITVQLNTPWTSHLEKTWKILIFTGPIDGYFKMSGLPPLEYRSIHFEWKRMIQPGFHQPASVVNYPGLDTPYTRTVEYKHFLHQSSPWTILSSETTSSEGEPYYPVPTLYNRELYDKYKELASQESDVHFVGRLATYKYFNMDQAIRNSMDYYRNTIRLDQ